jgi:uncharacterized protein YdaU (DUF1376 family)
MKLYIADYLADTTHLSRDEHGAYLLLLMAMWRAGGKLPAGDDKLAKLARCSPKEWVALKDTVLVFFKRSGRSITHKRISKEMAHYEAVSERRKEAGKRGGSETARKNNDKAQANAAANARQLPTKPEPELEPELEPERREKSPSLSAGKPSRASAPKRGPEVQIPDGFPGAPDQSLAEGWVAAARVTLSVGEHAKRFRNHAATNDRRVRDWPAAWRAWIDIEIGKAPAVANSAAAAPMAWNGPADVWAAVADAMTEPKARSYLGICTWQEVPFQAVIAPQEFCAEQLTKGAGQALAGRGVRILVKAGRAA